MTKTNSTLSAERLRELLHYEPTTGAFTRLQQRGSAKVGDHAGCMGNHGYTRILIDGVSYLCHRLAWLYVYGIWPDDQIDHRDGNRLNNRIANLREATYTENSHNLHKAQRNSKSGLLGVTDVNGKWGARIMSFGKQRRLGVFKTKEEASAAYIEAKRVLHPFAAI